MNKSAGTENSAVDVRTIRIFRRGEDVSPVVVVDNFSPRPDELIDIAATADFSDLGAYYPGPRAPAPKSYITGVADILAKVVKRAFGDKSSLRTIRTLFSIATRPPEELTLAQWIPHIDDVDAKALAVVHYLARRNFGGTAFYRHRSTGFESVNAARHARFLASLKEDFSRYGAPSPAYISGDTAVFNRIFRVDALFNRAVIYPSNLLHCAELPNSVPLPSDPRRGRLTVTTFLYVE